MIKTLVGKFMDTLLKTPNKLEFLPQHHGIRDKSSNFSSSKTQIQEFRLGHWKSHPNRGNSSKHVCVRASASALLELVPETKKESLEFELPMYDPSKGLVVDLAVVGGGPAGLAVAQQVSEAGLSVCSIDPSPKLIWPNNYGVWVDEFEAMDLLDCLDTTWSGAEVYIDDETKKDLDRPYGRVNRKLLKSKMLHKCISNGVKFHKAKVIKVIHEDTKSLLICNDGVTIQANVVLDATGFSRCLVQYDKPYNPGYQVAYGILAEVEEHPFDVDKMLFMDWRDSHLKNNLELKEGNSKIPTFLYAMPFSSNRIFLEETSLVARPGVPMKDIQERMAARLRHLGIKIKSIEEDEHCVIPMGGPLPVLPFVVFAHQDIFLLENQLPFELLQLIMDRCPDGKSQELRHSIEKFVLMNINEIKGRDDDPAYPLLISERLPTHLLDLLRTQLIGDAKPSRREPTNRKQTGKKWHSLRTVSELKNAGIDMVPSEERSLNIRFNRSGIIGGKLYLPTLKVDDSIEPLFVNLLAYEMCPDFDNDFEVTSYVCFMDMLIDSANDVRKLRHAHVLRNNLGSDELVANLFNEIRADMVPNIHIYEKVKEDIQMHYDQKWQISISQFVDNHLSTMWADIAFVAAVLELTMSFIQTWHDVKK